MTDFFDKTLQPTLTKASDDQVGRSLRRASLLTRLAGYATVVCFIAGVWVDWRFLPTMVIPAATFVFYSLISAAIRREHERRGAE